MFDYKSAGITDDDQITKGLMMEEKHKEFDQSQIISIMKNANKISDDTILDDKKRNSYRESVKAKYGDKAGEQFTGLVAEAKGLDKFYNKKISEEELAHKNLIIKQKQEEKRRQDLMHGKFSENEVNVKKQGTKAPYKTKRKNNYQTGL